jgi:hypothetical protein
LFRNAYDLIVTKLHLTEEGFKNLLSIKASINLGLTDKLKISFPKIKSIEKPKSPENLARSEIQDSN